MIRIVEKNLRQNNNNFEKIEGEIVKKPLGRPPKSFLRKSSKLARANPAIFFGFIGAIVGFYSSRTIDGVVFGAIFGFVMGAILAK